MDRLNIRPYGDDPTKTPKEMPESIDIGDSLNIAAHNSFTNTLTPSVFKDHQIFINKLTEFPETSSVTEQFNPTQTEPVKDESKQNITNNLASCASEFIPQINCKKDNDDDNNNNKTKMIEVSADQNNSVLARLELGLLLAEMKSQVKETCNEKMNEPICNSTFTY